MKKTTARPARPFCTRVLLAALLAMPLAPVPGMSAAWAQGAAGAKASAPAAAAVELPLESITLFSSGVGFFRHAGSVPAGGAVQLDFTAEELNDVLKSLTLTGAQGGASVSYPGQADLNQRLSGFGVDLRGVASRYDLLGRLRGVEVVVTRSGGGAALTGRVLGVETRKVPTGDDVVADARFVTLATANGLAELALDQVDRLEVTDARLAGEMAAAMELLAGSRDTRKKPVTVRFHHAAERVGMSYLQASPLWKLSYRLDLSELKAGADEGAGEGAGEGAAQLQGWAVVDNTTDRDWDGVAVSLVSGRPVSFVQDLYSPEFLQRPVVRPERYAGLRPQSYDQGVVSVDEMVTNTVRAGRSRELMTRKSMAGAGMASLSMDSDDRHDLLAASAPVAPAATSGAVGELFAYTLSEPVTLARGDSAMLPVVQEAVAAQAISVFNSAVQPKHPMRGVRLTNTTDLKLDAGPVTVLDGGTYAGDAQLDFLAPGAERLLTYALDLEVVVDALDRHHSVQTGGRFERGVLMLTRRQQISRTYTLKNTASKDRHVLIEHARNTAYALIDPPEGIEITGDLYRLPMNVPAGKTVKTTATQVRTSEQTVRLGRLNEAQLVAHAKGAALPADVISSLQQAAALKRALTQAERELAQTDADRKRIVAEQKRLRDNMKSLDRNNALYKRYLAKLNTQEDQLDALQVRRADVDDAVKQHRDAFEVFVAGLG